MKLMQFVSNKKWFLKRFSRRSTSIKLGYKNLYIFPNKFGFYWILASLLLFILGTNLESNITILISYLMGVIVIINLFLTHFNLHGLEINVRPQEISFAESPIRYKLIFKSKILRNNILLKFLNDNSTPLKIERIQGETSQFVNFKEKQRGVFYPELIYGKSSSPMSLFNCWFYWRPKRKIIVAPKLNNKTNIFFNNSNIDGRSKSRDETGDDFSYLKNYRKGESKSSIDWKSYARTNNLSSKEFTNSNSDIKLLKLNIDAPLEEALQDLCYQINKEYINRSFYSVDLQNGIFIGISTGYNHYRSCLISLAKYKR